MKIYELNEMLVEGIFVRESKNRFLCEVLIDGKIETCYVPSSARLENFLNMKGKKVFLTSNSVKSKTKYSLWSVLYRNKHIILNLKMVNFMVESAIKQNILNLGIFKNIHREKIIDSYKCDLLLENDDNYIVEIKTIISPNREALFPSVHSERSISQLESIKKLLKNGFKAIYIIVSLSSTVRQLSLNSDFKRFCDEFYDCVKLGMKVVPISLRFSDNNISILEDIKIRELG